MKFVTGYSENIKNIARLGKLTTNQSPRNFNELKKSYNHYLKTYQPECLDENSANPQLRVINDNTIKNRLINLFSIKSNLNDLSQDNLINNPDASFDVVYVEKFNEALNLIKKTDLELFDLLNLAFNYCFFAGSSKAAGGSTSSALGVLWMNPKLSWTQFDYVELMVHELTHQLLFIDERNYRHYLSYDLMNQKEYFAHSTILKKSRPLDKVIHSFFVGLNLVLFRQALDIQNHDITLHPQSNVIIDSLKRTLDSLTQVHFQIFSPRILTLLNSSTEIVRSF